MKRVKLSEYAKMQGVSVRTLHRRIAKGELKIHRSNTNRIYVDLFDEDNKKHKTVTYARVSSSENKSNLVTQSQRLQDFCAAKGWEIEKNYQEIGSGLNDDRKQLMKIFNNPDITRIVIEHKDRLTRFGFNYIKTLWNGEIIIINDVKNDEQDLMQDFVSLVTSFCARLYGKRRTLRKTEEIIRNISK